MVKTNSKRYYSEEELKKHKMGKDYVAKRLAEQESLNDYDKLSIDKIPTHLDTYATKEWKRVVPLLKQLPVAELDREMIESYCQLHSSRRKLEEDIQKNGITYPVDDREGNRVVRRNPAYDALLQTIKEQRMIANQLGMTMSSRLSLTTPDEETQEDEILKMLQG